VCGPSAHLLLQPPPADPGDVDADDRAGHRVEAGGVDDHVELEDRSGGLDPGLGDRVDRLRAQVDQPDVGQVEGLVVAGVQAGPLGAEVVVGGAERVRGPRVAHDRPDALAQQVGQDVVGRGVDPLVGEHAADRGQAALGQGGVEALPALLGGQHRGGLGRRVAGHPDPRPLRPLPVAVAVRGELGDAVGRGRAVVGGDGEVRGALEDRQRGGLLGDQRDGLHARGPGADHADPLAGQVHAPVRPAAGEVHLAAEPVGAGDVEVLGHRQAARGHHVVARGQPRSGVGADAPEPGRLVPRGLGDPGAEPDVAAQVVALGHELQVAQDLRLGGVLLRPGPGRLELGVEPEGVVGGGDVAARARGSGSSTRCRPRRPRSRARSR
jgi:hypothetical protein